MQVNNLKINNLRNIRSVDIEPGPGLNLLVGDNGAGKTSVLEALIFLAKGRSFRTGRVSSLIGPHDDKVQVIATIGRERSTPTVLGLERTASQWRAKMDGKDVRQLGVLAAALPLVLMEPNSLLLVNGPPDHRRRFLDWGVFHVEHAYLDQWRRYSRAVKQRNAALRNRDLKTVRSLDPQLADLGGKINELRAIQVELLTRNLDESLSDIGRELTGVAMRYRKGWSGEKLKAALDQALKRDMEQGATGPGPHRADLLFTVDERPARDTLSRGEQKTLAAALVLSQARMIAAAGERPVLLLDDFTSEFDERHRANVLAAGLQSASQLWVTGTSVDPVFSSSGEGYRTFHVEHGKITMKTRK